MDGQPPAVRRIKYECDRSRITHLHHYPASLQGTAAPFETSRDKVTSTDSVVLKVPRCNRLEVFASPTGEQRPVTEQRAPCSIIIIIIIVVVIVIKERQTRSVQKQRVILSLY